MLAEEHLPFYFLARYGGPFDVARVVDLGAARPTPVAPHVEDHVFVASRAKVRRRASAAEFWDLLVELARPRLREIFGDALQSVGPPRSLGTPHYGTALGQGEVSLGLLLPSRPPSLYLTDGHDRRPQIRMTLSDGQIELDAPVTDLRLRESDHTTPDADQVEAVARMLQGSDQVILGVGLTRGFRRSDKTEYIHYLQVTNIHLKEQPAWQLG